MRRVLVVPLVLALALAGCVSALDNRGKGADVDLPVPINLDPLVRKHDHWDASEHNKTLNMSIAAWLPLAERTKLPAAHAVDMHGDLVAVAVAGDETRGFYLVNVSDPRVPTIAGRFHDPGVAGGDRQIMFSGDGKTVFLASEGSKKGILAVDVSDPAAPKEVALYTPAGDYGSHTVYAAVLGGKQYVFALNFGVHILEWKGGKLELVGRYATATPDGLLKLPIGNPGDAATYAIRDIYGHDLFVMDDPILKKPVMYVAYAYEGLKIVDISNPALPREIATWIPGGAGAPWYVHTVHGEIRGDKRIIVVGSEVFENRHVEMASPVWILDATDLAKPKLLNTWTNPGNHGSDNLLFSAHDFRLVNSTLYLSHYHAGIWTLDLADPANPVVTGYATPVMDNGWRPVAPKKCCIGFNLGGGPVMFDVAGKGQWLFAADYVNGFYVLESTHATLAG
ncbi:MAG TPA: hypothetical protein VM889_13735 [Candidatus Thermoplasmatota archaeon]|nr:hypothetical protein [Candidatus Thermoplasmatota archaeon]